MPQVSKDFQIKGTLADSWKLLNDPQNLGTCIPGCQQVTIVSEAESRWKLKITVGVISRNIDAKARVTLREEPNKLALKVESVDGDINGEFQLSLRQHDERTTDVSFSASLDARGPFQWIVNQVIRGQMDKFTQQFADCVSAKLSKS